MSLVTPHLYIGDINNAKDGAFLSSKKITLIINCAKEIPNFFEGNKGIKYMRLDLNDVPNQPIEDALRTSSDAILNNIKKGFVTFVHCAAGISRSASVVIYTIMQLHNWGFETSYRFVKNMRPVIHPNPGFVEQMIKMQSGKHHSIDLSGSVESGEDMHETPVHTEEGNVYGVVNTKEYEHAGSQPSKDAITSLTLDNEHARPSYVRNIKGAKGTYTKIFSGSK